jgi:hypothetical protein
MMARDDTPRTDRPAGGRNIPLPGIKTAHDIQEADERFADADVDLESNELHAAGQVCERCGRAIKPADDVRRTASGGYKHEVCPPA